MTLYRLVEEGGEMLRLRLYHRGDSLPRPDVLPILENLGLRVMSAPTACAPATAGLLDTGVHPDLCACPQHRPGRGQEEFEDAFSASGSAGGATASTAC